MVHAMNFLFRMKSPLIRIGAVLWICLGLVCSGAAARAEEEAFRLVTRKSTIHEAGEVVSFLILADGREFSFLPPPGWQSRVEEDRGRRLNFTAADGAARIDIELHGHAEGEAADPDRDGAREFIAGQYPGGTILREYTCYASELKGVAFDLERTAANGTRVRTRVALIPYPEGRMRVDLTTAEHLFEGHRLAHANLVTSLQVTESRDKD
jgi:hypothetical protein